MTKVGWAKHLSKNNYLTYILCKYNKVVNQIDKDGKPFGLHVCI